jgi:hypothetical protein
MLREYFLYRHIRLDKNETFYIGIGVKPDNYSSERVEFKRAFEKTNRNKYWRNLTDRADYAVEILFESNIQHIIREKEIEFIKLYGRFEHGGTLVNMTDGGEGSFGRKWSEEFRANFIEKNSGENHFNFGKELSEETKKKKSEAMKISDKSWKGKKLPKETVEKIRQSKVGDKNPMYGKIPTTAKKIINVDTLEVFESFKSASKHYPLSFQHISENVNRLNNFTPFVFYTLFLEKGIDHCKTICNVEKKNKNQGIKKVKNKDTGEIFKSMKEASESIGMVACNFRYGLHNNNINFEIVK